MADPGPGEPRRVAGIPVQAGRRIPRVGETEQRVLGLPLSWFSTDPTGFSSLRHPIRWAKWRLRVHRDGPYAGDDDVLR